MNLEFLLYLTGALFTSCYIPQIAKSFRTKSVEDLSLPMWVICVAGYTCGLIYFLVNWRLSMICNYAPGLIANLIMVCLYFKYRRK